MKRSITIFFIMVLISVFALSTQALDLTNRLAVGANGGIIIPASGNVVADSSVSDYFDVGPSFGIRVKYGVMKWLSAETGFNYTYMKLKDEVNEDPVNEPYLNMPQFYLDGVVELGSFFNNPDNKLNPFVKAGVGLYPWKVTEDGVNGDAMTDGGEEFSKTSFGLNFGAGLEVFATDNFSFYTESKYHIVFTKDEDKFGPDFDNTGYLDVLGGINYYFPLSSSK